jgi:hypothetical protein
LCSYNKVCLCMYAYLKLPLIFNLSKICCLMRIEKRGLLLSQKNSRRVSVTVLAVFFVVALQAQPCDPFVSPNLFGQSQTFIFCKNNSVGFGVLNSAVGQRYEFAVFASGNKEVAKKGGPLEGNGGQLSVSAFMKSSRDAGVYRVTAYNTCGDTGSVQFAGFYGSVDNLSISSWGANAATFRWAASGPTPAVTYEYAVTTEVDPNSPNITYSTTTDTVASENNLVSGDTYYFYVRVKEAVWNGNSVDQSFDCDGGDLPWAIIKFVPCSGAASVGSIAPRYTTACVGGTTTLTASGGLTYKWYQDNNTVPIAGATAATYNASQPGQYRAYITTAAGCQGMVNTATVMQTSVQAGVFSGGGNFFAGDTVSLGISKTVIGQTYKILRDGVQVASLQGIGRSFEGEDTLWYRFVITSATQAGNYTVRASIASCTPVDFGNRSVALVTDLIICPGGSASFTVPSAGAGYTYQWQIITDSGNINLSNTAPYSGVNSRTLTITNASSNMYGYTYRVVATGAPTVISSTRTLKFGVTWTGAANKQWALALNWSCGKVPDANTDVVVPAGNSNAPIVSSNVLCRSLTTSPGSSITVNTGFNLTITGR